MREQGEDIDRAYRWDAQGRLVAVGDTRVEVDALGELAAVDDTPLLWDTTDPYTPLAWMGDQAVIGLGQPWATAQDGEATWLAPDWQGSVGGPRDPFGAPLGPADPGPRLGYGGELEFGGQTWLRARAYDPSTRSFLSPDPLPPVAGTPYFGNTYHYAGNDPLGSADPLGQRPVTDQELREIRDRMGSNFISRNKDWIIAGALIVGGIAVMATGVGGPLGAAMIGGALLSAGSSAAIQKVTTGSVNYTEVAIAGLVGGAAGGLGYGAGALVSGTSKAAAVGRGALAGGVESFAGGAANRGIHGQNPFDPAGMGRDLLLGGGIGGVGGGLGARTGPSHADEASAAHAAGGGRPQRARPDRRQAAHDRGAGHGRGRRRGRRRRQARPHPSAARRRPRHGLRARQAQGRARRGDRDAPCRRARPDQARHGRHPRHLPGLPAGDRGLRGPGHRAEVCGMAGSVKIPRCSATTNPLCSTGWPARARAPARCSPPVSPSACTRCTSTSPRPPGQGDRDALREALDAAWRAVDADVPTAELERLQEAAEELVPEEDDDWVTASGYASNAAAAVAYALRTRLTDNPQEAAWAARQAYDTTDYAAQQQLEDAGFDDAGEEALLSQPVVQEALEGLNTDLEAALAEPPAEETSRLRDEARQGGARLVELVRE